MQRRVVLQMAGAAGLSVGAGPSRSGTGAARPPGARIAGRDGVGLHYSDWGSGKPLVFVHAWALACDQWDYQIGPFTAAGRRCVTYDRRGHGRSDVPGRGYDYDSLADDLAAVLDGLDLRQATLVAHSMGAGEAVRYLTRHGAERVERVVLVAPTTPGVQRSADNPDGLDPQIFEGLRAVWQKDFPHWIDQNTDPFVAPETSPGIKRWLSQMMLRTPLPVAVATNRTVVDTDFRAELPRLKLPVLVIQGDRDMSAPLPLTGQKTAALIPGARLEVVAGAPHGLIVTHHERVNGLIEAFLQA